MSKATAVRGASVKRSTAAQRATAPQRSLVVRERRTRTTRRDATRWDAMGSGVGIIAPRRADANARARARARDSVEENRCARDGVAGRRARARGTRGGGIVDVGSGEDNADRIAASAGGAGDGDARRGRAGARGMRGGCVVIARAFGARGARRARARGRGRGGDDRIQRGFCARARPTRDARD